MDRFFRGFFAGFLAGIPMNLWSLLSCHVLNFGEVRFLDWMGIILYGNLPVTFAEQAYALWVHFVGLGTLGIIFAYLMSLTTPFWYIGKAIIFSGAFGFISYAVPFLFQVPYLTEMPLSGVLSNHIGALLWGLALGYLLPRMGTNKI